MSRKLTFWFFLSFGVLYLLLWTGLLFFKHQEHEHDITEIKLIHESTKEQFDVTITLPHFIALGGARYFGEGDLRTKPYSVHSPAIIRENEEILGLNIVDPEGKIIRAFPEAPNRAAIGQSTQNFRDLQESLARKESSFFSPPFRLLQGGNGFIFYAPITSQSTFRGWFATVIDGQKFFEKFRLSHALKTFELVIKDSATGVNYFATALEKGNKGIKSHVNIKGRDLVFTSWRKKEEQFLTVPWFITALIAGILSALVVYLIYLRELRRQSQQQMKTIRGLLQMTAKEALHSLVDLRTDKDINQKELTYLSNLIEQVDLLQTMTDPDNLPKDQQLELLPIVRAQLDDFRDVIQKKNLTLNVDFQQMGRLTVMVNERLIQHGLIHHVLFHLVVVTRENSTIDIFQKETEGSYELSFLAFDVTGPEAFQTDRRFEVARKVMGLYGGEISIENAETHGIMIKLRFPVRLRVDRT